MPKFLAAVGTLYSIRNRLYTGLQFRGNGLAEHSLLAVGAGWNRNSTHAVSIMDTSKNLDFVIPALRQAQDKLTYGQAGIQCYGPYHCCIPILEKVPIF